MFHKLATVNYVKDATVDTGAPCPECSDIDAFVEMNIYVREWGEYVRFYECCINCGQRIATSESVAEVLVEIPEHLRSEVQTELEKVDA